MHNSFKTIFLAAAISNCKIEVGVATQTSPSGKPDTTSNRRQQKNKLLSLTSNSELYMGVNVNLLFVLGL